MPKTCGGCAKREPLRRAPWIWKRRADRILDFSVALFLLAVFLLTGCAVDARSLALRMIEQEAFAPLQLPASPFTLTGLLRQGASDTLHVYIEGDGFAWQSRQRPSADPTPRDTVTLQLARADASGAAVLYLARPGQYPEGLQQGKSLEIRETVPPRYWTSARFAPEVVYSLDAAVSMVKAVTQTRRVRLVGFSGGGTLATLLAARRDDVVFLGTVAAVLDHESWTRYHQVSPLRESLNPLHLVTQLRSLPQRHLMSRADRVTPPEVNAAFCKALQRPDACLTLTSPAHDGPWEHTWLRESVESEGPF